MRGGKTHTVEREKGIREGGSRSPRGRTRASATHTYTHMHAYPKRCARTQCTYVAAIRACARLRARALQRRSRARVRAFACGNVCARVCQRRNSALLWRRYYVIAFVRRKNRALVLLDRVLKNIYRTRGCVISNISNFALTLSQQR